MRTAGLVLDFYDDLNGSILKGVFPSAEELPDLIKKAHILSPEEHGVLRDEAYALVLLNEGKVMRKFACVDAGNTALSALYFLRTADRLPAEAIKVAAANLIAESDRFGLPTLALKSKLASAGRKRDPMATNARVGDTNDWATRTNINSFPGGGKDTSNVLQAASTLKTASARYVDVSGLEPEIQVVKKTASITALERYPLDSYGDVEKAISYFEDFGLDFSPKDRHDFAVKTASRAQALGIEVPEALARYGSTEYAPDLAAHLASRRALCDADQAFRYRDLEKVAYQVTPENFAALLQLDDEATGLDRYYGGAIADPYWSTFGGDFAQEKVASYAWENTSGLAVTGDQLADLAKSGRAASKFDGDFTQAFAQDPITIFESMPDDSKAILARLASEG